MKKKFNLYLLFCLLLCGTVWGQKLYPVFDGHNSGKKGYIDQTGHLVVPFQYAEAGNFSEGFARVAKNGKYGFINAKGEEIIPLSYDEASDFHSGYALVRNGDLRYLINVTQERYLIDNLAKDHEVEVAEDLLKIVVNDHYGFVNPSNELMIPADYESASSYQNGVAVVSKEEHGSKQYYLLNTKGKETPIAAVEAREFSGGLLAVKNDKKLWGFMNEELELVISYQFKKVGDFSYGYAVFSEDGKEGYINDRGEKVVPAIYKDALPFQEGRALAFLTYTQMDVLDQAAKVIKKFDNIESGVQRNLGFNNGLCMLHLIVEPDPKSKDELLRQYGGVLTVYIDKTGKIVWKSKAWYSCFPASARVTMADFSEKRISEIQEGDKILTYDSETQTYKQTRVEQVEIHQGMRDILQLDYDLSSPLLASKENLHMDLKRSFQATANHPILTPNGVKTMGSLEVDQTLYVWNALNSNFEEVQISELGKTTTQMQVYNLKTEALNYVIDGVVVLRK